MKAARCKRNLMMISFAFLANFTSYATLESMQSSLNRGVGSSAVAVVYTSFVLSSVVLPPLAIGKLDCRKTLALGVFTYALYTLANFYPRTYTLIPAAFFLGMGASVLWAAMFYYIIQISTAYAKEKKRDVDEVSADFFGRFNAINAMSLLIGTVFMSVIFESLKNLGKPTEETVTSNITSVFVTTDFTPSNTTDEVVVHQQCGLHFKYASATSAAEEDTVEDFVLYILYSCFLLFNLLGVVLCLCLDEVGGEEGGEHDIEMEDVKNNHNHIVRKKTRQEIMDEESSLMLKKSTNEKEEQTALDMIKSTMYLMYSDKAAVLLVFITMHYGAIQGLARGLFNASWVSCALGVYFVPYSTCAYGVALIFGCYGSGKVLKYISMTTLFVITMVLEIAILIVLLTWTPSQDAQSELWLYIVIPIGIGLVQSPPTAQLGSIYGKFFVENKKAGTALLGVWNPLGSAISFGLSGVFFPIDMVILVLVACIVGTAFFILAEYIREKPYRKFGCVEPK